MPDTGSLQRPRWRMPWRSPPGLSIPSGLCVWPRRTERTTHRVRFLFRWREVVKIELPLDQINQRAWTSRDAFREFTREKAWTDAGEQAAFELISRECRGQPLLDIGIGAGRTIPLMMRISSDYIGIDYTASLLELSASQAPASRFRWVLVCRNASLL
jgi:hypothetical protein